MFPPLSVVAFKTLDFRNCRVGITKGHCDHSDIFGRIVDVPTRREFIKDASGTHKSSPSAKRSTYKGRLHPQNRGDKLRLNSIFLGMFLDFLDHPSWRSGGLMLAAGGRDGQKVEKEEQV